MVELEQNRENIRKRGLGLAAISYDPLPVLKSFAERRHITFPLLSDRDYKTIRAFDILNETMPAGTPYYGVPYPGTYVVDTRGVVVSKYFEPDYRERISASDILVRLFGDTAAAAGSAVESKHLRVTAAASMPVARPGERIALSIEVQLPKGVHVYAPGVAGYIPIEWKLEETPAAKTLPFEYPASRKLLLKAIKETVPVYEDRVRLTREITFGQENALRPLLNPAGELVFKGTFRYQACDDRECFVPETVPLEWRFPFEPLDRVRAPAAAQRKQP